LYNSIELANYINIAIFLKNYPNRRNDSVTFDLLCHMIIKTIAMNFKLYYTHIKEYWLFIVALAICLATTF